MVSEVTGGSKGGDHSVDLSVQLSDGGLELLNIGEGQLHKNGVMVGEASLQSLAQ
jgi:hypothetical protein